MDADTLECEAYAKQHELIEKEHGREAAASANYGWGVSGSATHLSIATKVYVPGGAVLVTSVNLQTGEMTHRWEDY
jgi:threonine dehydratase